MSTPWLRDDNRYTWADVANMSRGEFDRRRELHVIYGAETPQTSCTDRCQQQGQECVTE